MSAVPDPLDVVCLCASYDLKEWYGPAFAAEAPWIRLLDPDEVTDPASIRHAFAFAPAADAFAPFPRLALVSSAGAGVDGLLANPSLPAGAAVRRVVLAEQGQMMAGFALWHIIDWQRQMQGYIRQQEQALWAPLDRTSPLRFPVGVLGYGNMGRHLARALVLLGFPVTVLASRPRPGEAGERVVSGREGLHEIAASARAVVNLLPLTDATRGILDREVFARMRADSILINLGRGGHLVESDLLDALEAGRPGFAALDVFAEEPLPPEHPFWRHPKVRVTPHVAADADPVSLARYVAEGIAAFERGERPAGLVDRQAGY